MATLVLNLGQQEAGTEEGCPGEPPKCDSSKGCQSQRWGARLSPSKGTDALQAELVEVGHVLRKWGSRLQPWHDQVAVEASWGEMGWEGKSGGLSVPGPLMGHNLCPVAKRTGCCLLLF